MLLRTVRSCRFRPPSLFITSKPASCPDFSDSLLLRFSGDPRSNRKFSEKIRDPKDFTWQSGRPDDRKKKTDTKWTSRPETTCKQTKTNEKNPPVKKVSDLKNPLKWTGRPKETCSSLIEKAKSSSENGRKEEDCHLNVAHRKGKSSELKPTKLEESLEHGVKKYKGRGGMASLGGTSMLVANVQSPRNNTIVKVETAETSLAPPAALSPTINNENVGLQEQMIGLPVGGIKMFTKPSDTIKVEGVASANIDDIIQRSEAVASATSLCSPSLNNVAYAPDSVEPNATAKTNSLPPTPINSPTIDVSQRSNQHLSQLPLENRSTVVPPNPSLHKIVSSRNEFKQPLNRPYVDSNIKKTPTLKVVKETFNEKRRHRVYSFGLSETGALGLYKPNEGRRWRKFISRPLRHQFAEEIRVISAEAGFGFTLFYVQSDSNVKLYGCGLNSDFQLGPTIQEVVTYPSPIDIHINSPKTKVVSFSAGRAHSAVATDNEGVFLFGANSYGQCGRTVDENEKSAPECTITQIKNFAGEKVAMVNCGQDHTCFVTESGKVYSCGWGSEGQTGLGHTSHTCEPSLVQGDIKDEVIVKVTGKCDTVLALNQKGEIFGWGSNDFRQIVDDRDAPQINSPFRMAHVNLICGKIVDIAAGSSFCMVLNQDGDVFVWGCGILGGGPELDRATVPTLLPRTLFGTNEYQPKVIPLRVYCGLDHMSVMNSLNHVYSWGKNKHGCLGIGSSRDQYFPYKLAISANAVHVSCAVDHSVIVTDHNI